MLRRFPPPHRSRTTSQTRRHATSARGWPTRRGRAPAYRKARRRDGIARHHTQVQLSLGLSSRTSHQERREYTFLRRLPRMYSLQPGLLQKQMASSRRSRSRSFSGAGRCSSTAHWPLGLLGLLQPLLARTGGALARASPAWPRRSALVTAKRFYLTAKRFLRNAKPRVLSSKCN